MSSTFDPGKGILGAAPVFGSPTIDPNTTAPHTTTPQHAKQVVRADGEFADQVALAAFSGDNYAVYAASAQGVGLFASGAAVAAEFEGSVTVSGDCAVAGDHVCGGHSRTRGNHIVEGDIQLAGADYAEDFDVAEPGAAQPGTVMVLDDTGSVCISSRPYDRRVAGVVSGAGDYRPAVILDRRDTGRHTGRARRPLALMGKVYCRADANGAAIAIGDLLTTSSTPGHAMKADDAARAHGAVIGKALGALAAGRGLLPMLVALQ